MNFQLLRESDLAPGEFVDSVPLLPSSLDLFVGVAKFKILVMSTSSVFRWSSPKLIRRSRGQATVTKPPTSLTRSGPRRCLPRSSPSTPRSPPTDFEADQRSLVHIHHGRVRRPSVTQSKPSTYPESGAAEGHTRRWLRDAWSMPAVDGLRISQPDTHRRSPVPFAVTALRTASYARSSRQSGFSNGIHVTGSETRTSLRVPKNTLPRTFPRTNAQAHGAFLFQMATVR